MAFYCMIGNVAEMVYTNKTKTVITKGVVLWNSDFEQCKIYNHEELDGKVKANPMTGFRPVLGFDKHSLLAYSERHSWNRITRTDSRRNNLNTKERKND